MKTSLLAAVAAIFFCGGAHAFRPFDGTDAAVADPGTVEVELGAARLHQGELHSYAVPRLTVNYGLVPGTEVAVEAGLYRAQDAAGAPLHNRLQDAALVVKHVFRAGQLQEAEGPSIAGECALLLPHGGSQSAGVGCAAILSQAWSFATGHANFGLERTVESTTSRSLSLMLEGPDGWKFRPVGELHWAADNTGASERSLLGGFVFPASKELAFDIALRAGRSSDGELRELRVGLTWNFEPGGAKTQ